ncbi:MAG: lipopolysaccharide assembly protein LapA domain-containing protein [Coxiella endosymbiont of Dermacentor silvarum]
MRCIFYLFWILIILLGITFTVLNPQEIVLNYYLDTKSIYLPLFILLVLLIGVALGIIAFLPSWIKNKKPSSD